MCFFLKYKVKLIKHKQVFGLLLSIIFYTGNICNPLAQESKQSFKDRVPSMDELAGGWQNVSMLRSMPALNNLFGSAQETHDLLAVGNLSFPPITMKGTTGSISINGKTPEPEQTRWYPYQVLRKGSVDGFQVETSVRMIYEQKGLLFHILLTNNETSVKTLGLKINLTAYTSSHKNWGWKIPRDADSTLFTVKVLDNGCSLQLQNSKDQMCNCFSFENRPDELKVYGNSGVASYNITLGSQKSRSIDYVLIISSDDKDVHDLAVKSAENFDQSFARVKKNWQIRFNAMFTPDNPYFSGHLPVLSTSDKKLNRMYYMSAVSLLSVLRTGFNIASRVYVSNTPESNCTMMYFWDTREWATALALLDPAMMKQYLRSWLKKGIYNGYAEEYLTGTLQGVWYSANDYSIFILLNDYLNVTDDKAFLSEKINGKTVLAQMDFIATHWKQLVKPRHDLADYGGAENLLECVPTYINEVASFNAVNVWMMKRVADIQQAWGNKARAEELRKDSDNLLSAVLKLYVPKQGVWDALHNDGTRVQVRHIFDYATIGLTIPDLLTSEVKDEMTDFVERELLTKYWMRAQSLTDPAANVSDRPDHGPMGAYCAWPAETIAAMCQFKKYSKALDLLHNCTSTTYEGPFSQSRELMGKFFNSPVKIGERGSGGLPSQTYNASNGGGFAEAIIRGLFGYQPDFLKSTLISDLNPRGFNGELTNIQHAGIEYNVYSSVKEIQIKKVK